jgi:hypothetical protein
MEEISMSDHIKPFERIKNPKVRSLIKNLGWTIIVIAIMWFYAYKITYLLGGV